MSFSVICSKWLEVRISSCHFYLPFAIQLCFLLSVRLCVYVSLYLHSIRHFIHFFSWYLSFITVRISPYFYTGSTCTTGVYTARSTSATAIRTLCLSVSVSIQRRLGRQHSSPSISLGIRATNSGERGETEWSIAWIEQRETTVADDDGREAAERIGAFCVFIFLFSLSIFVYFVGVCYISCVCLCLLLVLLSYLIILPLSLSFDSLLS